MKTRQDAWSHENDLLLAETVLRHIREGSTQLNAFEEVGDLLNRTSAACGFRWNAVVRQKYDKAIQIARKQRKDRMRATNQRLQPLYQPETPDVTPNEEPEIQEAKKTANLEMEEFMEEFMSRDLDRISEEIEEKEKPMTKQIVQAQTEKPSSNSMSLDQVIHFLQNFKGTNQQVNHLQQEINSLKYENDELTQSNQTLEKKLSKIEKDYESMQADYEALMQIMDRARKMVLFEEEERPASKFKMDRNGNLERIAE